MLRIDSKNVNYSAASVVNDEVIATFYGDHSTSHIGISINFENVAKFSTNLSIIKSDLEDFLDQIAEEV